MPDQNPKPNQSLAEDEATRAIRHADTEPHIVSGAIPGEVSRPYRGTDPGKNAPYAGLGDSGELSGEGSQRAAQDGPSLAHKTLAGGKYQVDHELGRGGMSVVYAATDTTLGRTVAVKVLLVEYVQAVGPEAALRFQQEARSVAKLSHPHIISIYEYGLLEDGAPFIVMDYIVGASLADEMQVNGLMSEGRVLEIVKQSAEALRHSHAQGVVHRDIKPSNLLLTKSDDGEDFVRVVDFGIAKMQTQDTTGKLTRTGQVFGSPLYMSPEQCEGLPADARSDIYSLGCVAYELITGRPPHVGKNVVETMHRKMTTAPTPFAVGEEHYKKNKRRTDALEDDKANQFRLAFQQIILKMLASDPANRQQTADELLGEIKQLKGLMLEKASLYRPPALVDTDKPAPTSSALKKIATAATGIVTAVACATIVIWGVIVIHGMLTAPAVTPATSTKNTAIPPVAVLPRPQNESTAAITAVPTGPQAIPLESTAAITAVPNDPQAIPPEHRGFHPGMVLSGFLGSNLGHWKTLEGKGQLAFLAGDLERAGKLFGQALQHVDQLNEPDKDFALDVSLSDTIDVALAQGKQPAQSPVWNRYQDMLSRQKKAIDGIDAPLGRALDDQILAFRAGQTLKPEDVDPIIKATFDRVKKESNDEYFGDAQRLLNKTVTLLEKYNKEDGRLAFAYHNLSSIWAIKHNWPKAIEYADRAVSASKSGTQKEKNLFQAYYLKGWAQSNINHSPVDSYNKALAVENQMQSSNDLNHLNVLRRLAQYFRDHNQMEQARSYAQTGAKLAEGLKLKGKAHARKLEYQAYFYFVSGRVDEAVRKACDGLNIEDSQLPRQDYRVQDELQNLAKYYEAINQLDLAEHARARAKAIAVRLRDFDKIYEASSL